MKSDPVCGMDVPEDGKFRQDYAGQRYYFCSDSCLSKFNADPVQYKSAGSALDSDTAIYTCPMHPEVKQQGPGRCPKCGMFLEPEK